MNTAVGLLVVNFVTMKVDAPIFLSATQQISMFMNMDAAVLLGTVNSRVQKYSDPPEKTSYGESKLTMS